MTTTVVDAAGGQMGGAGRLLKELHRYLNDSGRQDVLLLGAARSLTPSWMVSRELRAASRHPRATVALNNVSFVSAGRWRTVLLRNALHFPLPGEEHLLLPILSRRVAAQAHVVRAAIRRADLVVVPASSMAARVVHWVPRAREKIAVHPHPVSTRSVNAERIPGRIVCPVLLEPWKHMGSRLQLLIDACSRVRAAGTTVEIVVTATEEELRRESVTVGAVTSVGRLSIEQMEKLLGSAQVVYYPTEIESFGYPLAEARANGQPVLAINNSHNAEVAGSALMGFESDVDSLAQAVRQSLAAHVTPSMVSNADDYFQRLLEPM